MSGEVRVMWLNNNDRRHPEHWRTAAYPPEAEAANVEGVVIVEFSVDEGGAVTQTRMIRSIPQLDAAAQASVRQWSYRPSPAKRSRLPETQTVAIHFMLL